VRVAGDVSEQICTYVDVTDDELVELVVDVGVLDLHLLVSRLVDVLADLEREVVDAAPHERTVDLLVLVVKRQLLAQIGLQRLDRRVDLLRNDPRV
jgi:hypothetical protein